jgi:hypothetical protein
MSVFEPAGNDGDSGGTTIGGGVTEISNTGFQGDSQTSSTPAEPSVIDLDENALIRVKGSDKPVKFADHVKGFQSQFTKASQRAAQLERELAQERQQRSQLQQAQQAAQQAKNNGASNEDIYAALRQLPYLTGEDAVNVVQSLGEQLRQRDMVQLATLQRLQQMQQIVSKLHDNHTSQSFESKINGFLTQGGYGPEYAEYAKELYLAYEGDDLDQEFPSILANRLAGLEKLIEAKRQQKVQNARRSPFVPGKGGTANPSKPLQIKADASSKDIADELWATFQNSGT